MNRIEEINNELKIIKDCEAAYRFVKGIKANGGYSENAENTFFNLFEKCQILDSTIFDIDSLKVYKKKLITERAFLKNNETKIRFEKWLDKPNHNKFVKFLKKKYGNNLTLGFNKHVEEL
jgi:hypothetical protein